MLYLVYLQLVDEITEQSECGVRVRHTLLLDEVTIGEYKSIHMSTNEYCRFCTAVLILRGVLVIFENMAQTATSIPTCLP